MTVTGHKTWSVFDRYYITRTNDVRTALEAVKQPPKTMEDAVKVLRQASQPLGPMGAEWLERQARTMEEGG
jgi:hypothetical protein